ncbi:glycosyltransferase [Mucilaginibacter sp. OK283]|uniref:glycosyltransferase n=1 Tax=Mucilaginibacter sp. OK283 TaxID=1881049 RepID=UPI0008B3C2C9|nr:glycosyltransferase [Mucilaginibacter sp. OK283]SEP39874.1 Glycosyltransferase involved in cell wall bisynthesis [Mucilaginibacter sp. OK283]
MKIKYDLQVKPRLFFIIPTLMGGGAERVLISLANHFNKLNFQSIIVSLNQDVPAYAIDKDVKVVQILSRRRHSLVYRLYYFLKTFYVLIKLLRAEKPVCAISFITSANIWAGITCYFTNTPYIVSERTSPNRSVNQFGYLHKKLAALIYLKSASVVVSAKGVGDCLLKITAFKHLDNINRIMNAVTTFDRVTTGKVHVRKFILGVGRLAFVKGFDMLIAAFGLANLDDTDLLIIGEGEERSNLLCQIHRLGLQEKVLLPGSKTNLQDYYSQAEMFVLPSRNEGYPNALVEAMSLGCPCIAVNCDFGPVEIIRDGDNGILVAKESIVELADAIVCLHNDNGLRERIGGAARNICESNSAQKILGEWAGLINKHARYTPNVP